MHVSLLMYTLIVSIGNSITLPVKPPSVPHRKSLAATTAVERCRSEESAPLPSDMMDDMYGRTDAGADSDTIDL